MAPRRAARVVRRMPTTALSLASGLPKAMTFPLSSRRRTKSRMLGSLIACVDQRVIGKTLRGLTGDVDEGRLGSEAVRTPQIVVCRHAVVAAASDVNRAEVRGTLEALGMVDRFATHGRVG